MSRRSFKLPCNIIPRDYQRTAVDHVHHLLTTDPTTWHLFSSPTGTGKSIIELMILSEVEDSIMITPRLEIIAGMLQKMNDYDPKWNDLKLVEHAWNRYGIITPIRLRNLLARGDVEFMPSCLVIDECFPAGTLVNTPDGMRPIDSIKTGEKVLTCDESNGIIGVGTVGKTYVRPQPTGMIEIRCNNKAIVCTNNHPFLTQRGWIDAGELATTDLLYSLQATNCPTNEVPSGSNHTEASNVLQAFMYGGGNESGTIGTDGEDKQGTRKRTHDITEPIETAGSKGESIRYATGNGAQTAGTKGQRNRVNELRKGHSRSNETQTIDNQNKKSERATQRSEDRSRESFVETCSGDRRELTQGTSETGTRQAEDRISRIKWMDINTSFQRIDSIKSVGGDTGSCVYNFEVEGTHVYFVNGVCVHNCHHDSAETYQDITMYLNGCPKVGLTATPYRGTPKQTNVFHKQWGDTVNQVLSLADAVEMGFYQIPDTTIWPLIDDDTVDISNGDFKVKHIEAKLRDCYELIVSNCEKFLLQSDDNDEDSPFNCWDMPTIFAMPETESVSRLKEAFDDKLIPVNVVTQATSRFDRIKAFEECVNCTAALIQINVVSEGVDLPIRRVIDCAPTMSPVRWMQQVGRIRPNKPLCECGNDVPYSGYRMCMSCGKIKSKPEYICCCRNLERHCYLWEGLLPNAKVAEAQSAFTDENGVPIFSKRSGTRVVGLEGLGRFTTTDVHLNNGTIGFMYNLVHVSGTKRTEYIAFVHPNNPDPVYGIKESAKKEDGTLAWGKWALIKSIPDVSGCVSAKINPLTDRQIARWKQSAEGKGLDPHREVNTREFQVLPFLRDTGLSFRT